MHLVSSFLTRTTYGCQVSSYIDQSMLEECDYWGRPSRLNFNPESNHGPYWWNSLQQIYPNYRIECAKRYCLFSHSSKSRTPKIYHTHIQSSENPHRLPFRHISGRIPSPPCCCCCCLHRPPPSFILCNKCPSFSSLRLHPNITDTYNLLIANTLFYKKGIDRQCRQCGSRRIRVRTWSADWCDDWLTFRWLEIGVIFCSGGMSLPRRGRSWNWTLTDWLIEIEGGLFLFGGVLMFFDRSLYVLNRSYRITIPRANMKMMIII